MLSEHYQISEYLSSLIYILIIDIFKVENSRRRVKQLYEYLKLFILFSPWILADILIHVQTFCSSNNCPLFSYNQTSILRPARTTTLDSESPQLSIFEEILGAIYTVYSTFCNTACWDKFIKIHVRSYWCKNSLKADAKVSVCRHTQYTINGR